MTDSTDEAAAGRNGGPEPGRIYAAAGQIYPATNTPRMYLVIREEAWREQCARRGYTGDATLGAEFGVSATTVWRIRTRQARPGINFVLQAMRIFTGAAFEELFEVMTEERAAPRVSEQAA